MNLTTLTSLTLKASMVLLVFSLGLDVTVHEITYLSRRARLLGRSLLAMKSSRRWPPACGLGDSPVGWLCGSSRHPAVALAIAVALFPEQRLVMATGLLYLIVNALVSLPYLAWRGRHGPREQAGTARSLRSAAGPTL